MASEKEKSKSEPKKMMDVSKPGETPADATSRPVIVKHRSIAKDPMVSHSSSDSADDSLMEKDSDVAKTVEKEEPVSRKGPKLVPLSDSSEDNESEELEKSSKEENDEPITEDKAEKSDEVEKKDEPEKLGTAAVDVLANEAVKKKQSTKEDREKEAAIKKHIDEKTYYAPIGQISKRRARMQGVIGIIFLLLLLGVYIAIDAELFLKDIALPFELIK